ncbi:MAG: glycosyltransferase [FCB group bacterium]|nr:glycosyltransferase [FCB group bacterium]
MNNIPKYSVVIPSYNNAKILPEILDALLKQEGSEEAEVIVVDDGSKDNTEEIVKDYPVRYFKKPNGGPASARNVGIKESKGDIVLFIDSDCVPQPGWLKAMTQPFENDKIDGVKGIYITRQKSITARFIQLEFEERYQKLSKLEYIDFIDSYSAAFRKEKLIEVGGFDESFPKADNEDVDLSYKLAGIGCKMVFQPSAVVQHTHPDDLIMYIKVKYSRAFWRSAVYIKHPRKALKDSYTPQSLKLQMLSTAGIWIGIFFAAVFNWNWWLFACLSLYIFSLLPFIIRVYGKDDRAESLAPFMLFIRSNCFLLGTLLGSIYHRLK